MTDTITLTGLVATDPKHLTTGEGLSITSFRLASTQRRYDRSKQSWVDGDTNWYTVTAFRRLATNVSVSLVKGQRVLISGRMRVREWADGQRKGISVEVEAESIGHDLLWGTSSFTRSIAASRESDAEATQSQGGSGSDADSGGWAVSEVADASQQSHTTDASEAPTAPERADAELADVPF
ncbi:single-strand DNA-binding protein [Homoserinimonas aerilata]|uniref:Single-stranded DNA-binding protein n=1 Tax=Homoserinimonas aerilata TaxID=1162970 RepID=A0A542YHY1_9MICO|nr:single-stranded DNA-binding protein [Homoserinimonas aerilata]TQL47706.1 single-strand DNA-binding protein [Homoserinimonas aerilata]